MGKSATMVAITSNGKRTGTLTPEAFRKGIDAPKSLFLSDIIKRFNENKEKAGEPERAEQVLESAILESALSFSEKRALQKTVADGMAKLKEGKATFSEKRTLQKAIQEAMAKLNAKVEITPPPPEPTPVPATMADVLKVMPLLKQFIGASQLEAVGSILRGEEGQYFKDKLIEIATTIQTMPKTYDTDGQGDGAVAHLHYFRGGSDWYITEKDKGARQEQAFGYTILNGDTEMAESGYISIIELLGIGAELDFYWTPKSLGAVKGKISPEPEPQPEPKPVSQNLLDLQSGKFDSLDPLAFLGKLKEVADEINDIEPLKGPAIAYIEKNADKVSAIMESALHETFGKLWTGAGA